MRTLGNIIWHFPYFGWLRALIYAIGGLFWCITIIGIPLGVGLFQLSLFMLAPFSKGLVTRDELALLTGEEQDSFVKTWSFVIRILYFPFGLIAAFGTVVTIGLEFGTLVGIPCGLAEAKALPTIFNPINKKCVPRVIAEEIERRKASNTLNKYMKASDTPISTTAAQVTEKISEENDAFASVMSEYLHKAETKTDEELKSILQNKGDYSPRLIKAAEKILLDRITGVAVPEVVTPINNEDRYKAYQPGAQKEEQAQSPINIEGETKAKEVPVTISQSPQPSQPLPQVEEVLVVTSSKDNDKMLISILIGVLLVIGGVLVYFLWYAPYVKDRDAPRTYVVANSVFLRSSQLGGIEYNIVDRVSYGSEVITYGKYGEWAEVKANGQEGFISSAYLLDASDFNLLNGVWGDNDAKECIESSKCRMAILDYYKNNTLQSGTNGWQIYTRMKDQKPNTVFYPRIYDRNSKFTDFVFILKNAQEGGTRTIVCYSFEDESEKPIFRFSAWVPMEGYIQNILPTRGGVNIVFDDGTRTKVEIQ